MGNKETRIVIIDPLEPDVVLISEMAKIIQNGGTVAFPTETVYGIGANALDTQAVEGIFSAKGRPQDNPLIVHIADLRMVDEIAREIPDIAYLLMERFWPGALTLILKKRSQIPRVVTAGLDTVAVRSPAHEIACNLIRQSTLPIAAPSANISGKPSPTRAAHVIDDLYGRVDAIIDGGHTRIGLESTVLDMTTPMAIAPEILRPGEVTKEQLEEFFSEASVKASLLSYRNPHETSAMDRCNPNYVNKRNYTGKPPHPKSPGTKYKHYAPNAEMIIFTGTHESIAARISIIASQIHTRGTSGKSPKRIGVYATNETLDLLTNLLSPVTAVYPVSMGSAMGGAMGCAIGSEMGSEIGRAMGCAIGSEMGGSMGSEMGGAIGSEKGSEMGGSMGGAGSYESLAGNMFDSLRKMDEYGVDLILAEGIPQRGLGRAIMDRLTRAASGRVINTDICRYRKILFVCTGNTCRSCMAEAFFNHASRGAAESADEQAKYEGACEKITRKAPLEQAESDGACENTMRKAPLEQAKAEGACEKITRKAPLEQAESDGACENTVRKSKRERIVAESAGVFAYENDRASELATSVLNDNWGISLADHRARVITIDMLNDVDLILTMGSRHKESILLTLPNTFGKVFTLLEFTEMSPMDIADPYGADEETYRKCASQIKTSIDKLITMIK